MGTAALKGTRLRRLSKAQIPERVKRRPTTPGVLRFGVLCVCCVRVCFVWVCVLRVAVWCVVHVFVCVSVRCLLLAR